MKTRKTLSCVVLAIGVLLYLTNCATTKTPLPTDNIDELLGTWVNPDYKDFGAGGRKAKYVYKEDMTAELYEYQTGNPAHTIHITVKKKWGDNKGAVYFLDLIEIPFLIKVHRLVKVSSNGKTLEVLEQQELKYIPSEMDPDAPYFIYLVWYRQ